MFRKSMALLVSTSLLSACYSFSGPRPVLERGNVVHADSFGPRTGYLYERFRRATLVASGCEDSGGEPPPPRTPTETIDQICDPSPFAVRDAQKAAMEEFMRTGFALIYADCAAYFAHMGRNQGRSRLARSAIGPIGDLIQGIISIVRFENSNTRDDLLGALALGATAGTAGIEIYDSNFLFGADNIDAVRQLIQRALSTHAAETLSERVRHDTFGQAANHLDDNQAICKPSHILTLVRQAIAAGDIDARRSSELGGPEVDEKDAETPEVQSVSVSVPQ